MPSKKASGSKRDNIALPEAETVPVEEHPDYVAGTIGTPGDTMSQDAESEDDGTISGFDEFDDFTPIPGGPIPPRIPGRIQGPVIPKPFPGIPGPIQPQFCSAVRGRYRYNTPFRLQPQTPPPIRFPAPRIPRPLSGPVIPFNMQTITVRVDVDRFYPQQRISVEVVRRFPRSTAHAIAEVISDSCTGLNRRTVRANIVYRDGNSALIPGTTMTFRARRTTGFNYGAYTLELSGGGITARTYDLHFISDKFDDVEFEVDRVQNAGSIVTSIATHAHPNRPASLPSETITLTTAFDRAGFGASFSPNASVIPNSGAGTNGTWSDTEMHNAMVTYWSRFANRPSWAMWVLYAARHDQGRSLGGVMFDDIGPNHRQGTAIFTDSFIQDAPAGDPDAAAWRRRMEFWTAIHEIGHGFNLTHAWQKALGTPQGAPGDPWIPLANEPESRSFMNYPFRVSGGENAFFSNFEFRFSDDELVFMRHAPRRFVQMGNSDWFVNHGFEAPDALMESGEWELELRPNRANNTYRFLEPVVAELKLTNTSGEDRIIDEDMLMDGGHFTLFVQREGALTKRWTPMMTACHEEHQDTLGNGESIYGAHNISATGGGWTIDEPGFYKVQAAVNMGEEIVVSNVLRVYVAPPESTEEAMLAPDYFTEDVGRVIAFKGAPALDEAEKVLEKVAEVVPENPAAKHAKLALSNPKIGDFKVLDASDGKAEMAVKALKASHDEGVKQQKEALLDDPQEAADTFGHIPYFGQLRKVAEEMEDEGDEKGAIDVMEKSVELMKKRNVLKSVIDNTEDRIKRRKS